MIPKKLRVATIQAIQKHAEEAYPNECCGVVIVNDKVQTYVPCENIAKDPLTQFKISPVDFCNAEDLGEVVGIVHSHPDGNAIASAHDIAAMSVNRSIELELDPNSKATPWHIVSWPNWDYKQYTPAVHKSLLGRQFIHGLWDCWGACSEYFKRYHNLSFPKFDREDCWWEDKDHESLYEKNFESAGFYKVNDLRPGDMVVMQIGKSYHPNHAGIYLGDVESFEGETVRGGPFMFHHLYGRKSEICVFGGQWEQRTRMILRHKEIV